MVKKLFLTSSYIDAKTPNDIEKFIKENIIYHGVSKKYLYTAEEVVKYKKGHCWEISNLIYLELLSLNFIPFILYISDKENEKITHSTIIYTNNYKDYFWFEGTRTSNFGISKSFKSHKEICNHIVKTIKEEENITEFDMIKLCKFYITEKMTQLDYIKEVKKGTTVDVDF